MEALLGELPVDPVERLRLAAVGGNALAGTVCLVATVTFGSATFAGTQRPTDAGGQERRTARQRQRQRDRQTERAMH
jgi:hypothetical protein